MQVTIINLWNRQGMLHYTSQLANGLAQLSGIRVTTVLPTGTSTHLFNPTVALEFVDVVTDASVKQILLAPYKLLKLPRFLNTIEQTRPDVIHLNSSHIWFVFTLPILARRWPIVATLHDVHPHPGHEDTLRKRLERHAALKYANKIFVHGQLLKQQLLEAIPTLFANDISVIPHGDYSFFTRWEADVTEEDSTVLFFGRILAYKGLEYLIAAAPLVARRVPGVHFVIAGEGDLSRYQEVLADQFVFEVHNRYIPDEQVPALFQRAALVVLPYIEASQSGVIPVAYAFRKPVVSTSVGCIPDVVEDGKTGLLVPPRDPEALADAIIHLLRNKKRRQLMGQHAYAKMKSELGWENIAQQTFQVYSQLVGKRCKSCGS